MTEIKQQLFIVLGCVFHQGKVLLIKRNEPKIPEIHGNWELPGGKVRFGESPINAAIREIKEETGIIVQEGKLLSHIHTAIRKPSNFLHIQPIIFCYACKPMSFDLEQVDDKKIQRSEWVSIEDIDPFKLQSGSFEFIKKGNQELGISREKDSMQLFEAKLHLKKYDATFSLERHWRLQIRGNFVNKEVFHIHSHWNVKKGRPQRLRKVLCGRSELIHFLDVKLQEKQRKGYSIVNKSENFPYIRRLRDFPVERSASRQLTLF